MSEKKKTERWCKPRHKFIKGAVSLILSPINRFKFGLRPQKFKEQGKRNYLIIANHQTSFDQFFVGQIFKGPVYYVTTEDLFSNGFVSKLIKFLVEPIPIKKQSTDMRAVMNCIKVAKEGGSICIFPEGNRTYSGTTEYFNPAIVKLAKFINLPIAFVRIEGGYGVEPRWGRNTRKGKSTCYVSKVMEPEEYKNLPNEELFDVIKKNIYVDDRTNGGTFKSRHLAEYLERAVYVCPDCGLSTFISKKDKVTCLKCGKTAQYHPDLTLTGVDCDFPFKSVKEWYDYQTDFINKLDVTTLTDQPVYTDTSRFSEVRLYKNKKRILKNATVCLYGDRITVSGKDKEFEFKFDDLSVVTVLGRNKLNVYHKDKVYQFKPHPRFNSLKFVHFYYRYKNIKEGNNDGYLGI